MVLIDTSVWVDHLRQKDQVLSQLLMHGQVCIHPMIIGELACGHLHNRPVLLSLWSNLPQVTEASHQEVLFCLDEQQLMGKGIGFIDAHLLSATLLTPDTLLWTNDRRLKNCAQSLNCAFSAH